MKKIWKWAVALLAFMAVLEMGKIIFVIAGMYRRSYELTLPEQEKLKQITLESGEKRAEITDLEEIKEVIYVLSGGDKGRTTNEESINDAPVNADVLIMVNFYFKEQGVSTLFVYQRGGRYYIEQPYDGVYRISGDEYNAIEKYIRESGGKRKWNRI